MAEAAGVSTASVAQWFSGDTKSLATEPARRLALFLRCDRDWLARGSGLPGWYEIEGVDEQMPSGLPYVKSRGVTAAPVSPLVTFPAPVILTWEDVMRGDGMPDRFGLAMPDGALAPRTPMGTMLYFEASAIAGPGEGVLVEDSAGQRYVRMYAQGPGGSWQATARAEGYWPLESARDGLTLLARQIAREDRMA